MFCSKHRNLKNDDNDSKSELDFKFPVQKNIIQSTLRITIPKEPIYYEHGNFQKYRILLLQNRRT